MLLLTGTGGDDQRPMEARITERIGSRYRLGVQVGHGGIVFTRHWKHVPRYLRQANFRPDAESTCKLDDMIKLEAKEELQVTSPRQKTHPALIVYSFRPPHARSLRWAVATGDRQREIDQRTCSFITPAREQP